jgi:hypothetical protein
VLTLGTSAHSLHAVPTKVAWAGTDLDRQQDVVGMPCP